MDFFGKTLATASSDRSIKIFTVAKNSYQHIADLNGHTGPVWRVSWAHPRFGQILASCGYDRRIIIWTFNKKQNSWVQWFTDDKYAQSVNCIQFAPTKQLELIAGCADGSIHIYTFQDKRWTKHDPITNAHNGGVNCISFATPASIVSLASTTNKSNSNSDSNNNMNMNINNNDGNTKRFVSGGCDHVLRIWNFNARLNKYIPAKSGPLIKHENWIRDVSWSPIPGTHSNNMIASCSEDKTVVIWEEEYNAFNKWKVTAELPVFAKKVWSVSWSELGNILAVASGENCVQLFKQHTDGKWYDVTRSKAQAQHLR
jgi:protein transport protein SEC13